MRDSDTQPHKDAVNESIVGRLARGGYLMVPIRAGEKRPALARWQDARLSARDVEQYVRRGCGVGVLCGQGEHPIAALDVDTTHAELAAQFSAWCHDTLGLAPERVGRAPKTMLVYCAAEAGWTKQASRWFTDENGGKHRLEILGNGQQFVTHHVHPDTGRPYEWVDILGGIEHIGADQLPTISEAQVTDAIRVFECLAVEAGLQPEHRTPAATAANEDPFGGHVAAVGATLAEAAQLLQYADNEDYDEWLRAGMALHHEFGGADDALAAWDAWSGAAANYQGLDDLAARWGDFGKDQGRQQITLRWLMKAAKAQGADIRSIGRPQRRAYTEFGLAERMVDTFGNGLMYVAQFDAWYTWAGVHWQRAHPAEIEHRAKATVQALPEEAQHLSSDEERTTLYKFCAASQRANTVRHVVDLSRSDPRVVASAEELDADPYLLGVGNGAVDLRTGGLLAPDPQCRITVATPVEYSPDARASLFEQTLSDTFFGDWEMVAFFHRLVGYTLLGQPREQIIVIPYGSGANGKSTVLGAIRQALGQHARVASAETFLTDGRGASNAGTAREDLLRLRGSRFVYVGEPDEGAELREGLVKAMTGGEPLPARGLYSRTTVEVTPTWVPWMPTNHRPIIKGDDFAVWRRILLVPFTRNFAQDERIERDPQRAEKLGAELPGILAWCVRGALEYQRLGLQPPAQVQRAREAYKGDMDLLGEWIESHCEIGTAYAASNSDLWTSWKWFADGRGVLRYIGSMNALGRRLEGRGYRRIKDEQGVRGRGFSGIGLKESESLV